MGRLDGESSWPLPAWPAAMASGGAQGLKPRPRTPFCPNVFRWLAPALEAEPLLQRFRPDPGALQAEAVSCTGSAYCSFALIPTKGTAQALVEEAWSDGLTA